MHAVAQNVQGTIIPRHAGEFAASHAFDKRIQSDYGVDAVIAPDRVQELIGQAQEFLGEIQRFLAARGESP